jgi:hypothetical protein
LSDGLLVSRRWFLESRGKKDDVWFPVGSSYYTPEEVIFFRDKVMKPAKGFKGHDFRIVRREIREFVENL